MTSFNQSNFTSIPDALNGQFNTTQNDTKLQDDINEFNFNQTIQIDIKNETNFNQSNQSNVTITTNELTSIFFSIFCEISKEISKVICIF